ncbi:MAG: CBS domain-containing protein [Streptosporangiales bacterium]|nr:CBS domain-containing protein [Streptosporangiales bacterium]
MRARDIAEEYPVVNLDADALDAARLLVGHQLPGIVVTDTSGRPHSVLPGSQVLGFMIPSYIQDDPSLARVYDEAHADRVAARLAGRKVREVLPSRPTELPAVDPDATVIEVAALMARLRCPLVAVVENERVSGVITTTHLLDLILPRP